MNSVIEYRFLITFSWNFSVTVLFVGDINTFYGVTLPGELKLRKKYNKNNSWFKNTACSFSMYTPTLFLLFLLCLGLNRQRSILKKNLYSFKIWLLNILPHEMRCFLGWTRLAKDVLEHRRTQGQSLQTRSIVFKNPDIYFFIYSIFHLFSLFTVAQGKMVLYELYECDTVFK